MKKISIILPTNRVNSEEQLNIIHKMSSIINNYESNKETVFCKEFTDLVGTYVDRCTHLLKPTLLSLTNQTMHRNDYEILLCHKHPEDIEETLKCFETRINIKVLKEKPSIWHELGNYPTINNNRNTGIINATGELLFFLDDLTIFGPHLLDNIWNEYQNGYYVTCKAIRRIRYEENPSYIETPSRKIIIHKNIRGALNFLDIPLGATISTAATWTYATSVNLEECLQINGFDEVYDGSFGGTDQDLGRRLSKISKYRRKLIGTIYEFSSAPRGKIKLRNDEMLRTICCQSPNPVHIRANTWKPDNRQLRRYEAYHRTKFGELDVNWNRLMDVPLIDLNEERKKNLHI